MKIPDVWGRIQMGSMVFEMRIIFFPRFLGLHCTPMSGLHFARCLRYRGNSMMATYRLSTITGIFHASCSLWPWDKVSAVHPNLVMFMLRYPNWFVKSLISVIVFLNWFQKIPLLLQIAHFQLGYGDAPSTQEGWTVTTRVDIEVNYVQNIPLQAVDVAEYWKRSKFIG